MAGQRCPSPLVVRQISLRSVISVLLGCEIGPGATGRGIYIDLPLPRETAVGV